MVGTVCAYPVWGIKKKNEKSEKKGIKIDMLNTLKEWVNPQDR